MLINYSLHSPSLISIDPSKPLIKVNHISKAFSPNLFFNPNPSFILKDITFNIMPGQIVGLVGNSGSGKSSLAKILARLSFPSSGSVFFLNHDIFSLSNKKFRSLRSHIQLVFQNPFASLNNSFTIQNILLEGIRNFKILPRSDQLSFIDYLLNLVGLNADIKSKHPFELSGGECQRVAIARALSVKPNFIIFDEPTSALDPIIQHQIISSILNIQKKFKLSFLFISHNIGLVKDISDFLLVLNNGQIIEAGNPNDIFYHPTHPHTKKIISSFKNLSSSF